MSTTEIELASLPSAAGSPDPSPSAQSTPSKFGYPDELDRDDYVLHSRTQITPNRSQSFDTSRTIPTPASRDALDVDLELEEEPTDGSGIEALPPVDGGKKAWLFLLGATYIEMIIWGLPFSIGILHAYWTEELFHGQGASTITLAATLQTGLLYMLAALFGPLFTAFPRWTKTIQVIGLLIASSSMIASAFVTKPWHLLVTVGLFYPLACACYLPCATLIFEWFYAKRGWATGVMYSGTGLGGTLFPLIMQGLIRSFGYKGAMISLGIGYAATGMIALIPIKRRVPLARYANDSGANSGAERGRSRRHQGPRVDWSFLKKRSLPIGTAVILLTSMGNFIPSLWLPSYANDLQLKHPDGTSLISIMNASSVIGNGLLGYLSDKFSLRPTMLLSCLGSAIACAFLWGFAGPATDSKALLVVFSIVFGMLGSSFASLWSKMIGIIAGDDHAASVLVWSLFTFVRGCGNMSSGPVSDALLKSDVLTGAIGGYGFKNYGILLVYTALTITAGSVAGLMFKESKPEASRRA